MEMTEAAEAPSVSAAPTPGKFDHWAIVEIFGHQRIAGRVREELVAGKAFLRVDVPEIGDAAAFTRYYGGAAIYSLTPTTEEIARLAAQQLRAEPITVYIPSTRQLTAGADYRDPDYAAPGDPDIEFEEDDKGRSRRDPIAVDVEQDVRDRGAIDLEDREGTGRQGGSGGDVVIRVHGVIVLDDDHR